MREARFWSPVLPALAAASLIAIPQVAIAGNFLVRPVPFAVNWAGFYVGANAGYGWAHVSSTITSSTGAAPLSNSGDLNAFIGGGQIGYNWQISNFVLGLEADFQASSQKQSSTISCGAGCSLNESSSVDRFGTARGRIGYAYDRVMVYGTGGAVWSHESDNLVGIGGGSAINSSSSNFGWTLGGGAEWMVLDRWSVKLEYLYIRVSSLSGTGNLLPYLGGAAVTESVNFNNSIVRVGVNYHF